MKKKAQRAEMLSVLSLSKKEPFSRNENGPFLPKGVK